MTTLQRVTWIAADHFLYHKWFASVHAANDYVNELHTLGAESIDMEDVMVPQDLVGDLVHFLNKLDNHPRKDHGMATEFETPIQTLRAALRRMGYDPTLMTEEQMREKLRTHEANLEYCRTHPKWSIDRTKIADCAIDKRAERDPNGLDANAPGAKLDAGKDLPWLCIAGFSRALAKVAEVTTVGARKYSPNGWMDVVDGETRYMEAFGRHMLSLGRGERYDADTGAMHKAQMIWNLMASLELELKGEE